MPPGRLKIYNGTSGGWEYVAPGLQGATGPSGPSGPAGATGVSGSQGIAGPTGATGPQGATGAQGSTGPQGAQGVQGVTGSQGPQGATGAQGSTGPAGEVTLTGSQTLTGKRIDPRVSSTASGSSVTPTIASYDQYVYTALAADLTINAPTGTPVVGNKLMFAIKDNGTSRTLTWNAAFAPVGVTPPAATTVGKWTYVGCIYNANATRWDVIAVATEA